MHKMDEFMKNHYLSIRFIHKDYEPEVKQKLVEVTAEEAKVSTGKKYK